jgi:hypothetical protein
VPANGSCDGTNNSILSKVTLYCDPDAYSTYSQTALFNANYDYNFNSFFSQTFNGRYIVSFENIDDTTTYVDLNKQAVQRLILTINLSSPTATCSVPGATNLEVYFTKNVFPLKEMQVIIDGTQTTIPAPLTTTSLTYGQAGNTIVYVTDFLYFIGLRNLKLKALTFVYPYNCKLTTQPTSAVWGLTLEKNGLTQLSIERVTFGADPKYLSLFQTD